MTTAAPSPPGPWPITSVGSQFDIQLGKMLDAARNTGDLKPYIGNRAVQWRRLDLSAIGLVPLSRTDQLRYRLRRGDLLVCEGGEIGRATIWNDELPECYFQKALHRLRPISNYDPRVMAAILEYWAGVDGFSNYVTQTSIAHLPREKFLTMPLPLIPEEEQRRLAEILQDIEQLMAALEELIGKKQAILVGMMQQLLGGRVRLPGYAESWTLRHLDDHVKYIKTVALSRAELNSHSPLRYIHYGDIHTSPDVLLAARSAKLPRASYTDAKSAGRLAVGDTIFVDASEDIGGVAKSIELTSVPDEGVVAGLHTIAARFDRTVLADGFKAYLQFMPEFRNALSRLAAGTKVLASTKSHISSVVLKLPPVEEQRAIAQVLRDGQLDVEVLQRRLAKARAIKQGMTQQLLTGRTRLAATGAAVWA